MAYNINNFVKNVGKSKATNAGKATSDAHKDVMQKAVRGVDNAAKESFAGKATNGVKKFPGIPVAGNSAYGAMQGAAKTMSDPMGMKKKDYIKNMLKKISKRAPLTNKPLKAYNGESN